jgi:predicted dehydrogenase
MDMKPLRVGVVGVGSLGQHHARILANLPGAQLVGVLDPNQQQAETIAAKQGCKVFADLAGMKGNVDAVSIVTPTRFHCGTAVEFLAAGIPCMVEKPLAATVPEARWIVNTAKKAGTLLQVGHIERFNPGFQAVERSRLRPKYIEGQRLAPFSGRALDVGVVLDLMIHDLDLVLALNRSPVVSIDALGISVFGQHEDLANVRLHFGNGCVATLTASRVHPQAVRTMNLFGAEGYAGIDFGKKSAQLLQPTLDFRCGEPDVRQLDAAAMTQFKEQLFGEHLQSRHVAPATAADQLTAELTDFVDAVQTGRPPQVPGEDGLAAVELAHSILALMAKHDWEGDGRYLGSTAPLNPTGPLFEPDLLPMRRAA